jgi:hypothetical protein
VQDRELLIERHDRVVCPLHVVEGACAGAQNQRFSGLSDGLEERDVRQVARCDLVARDVDPLEEFDAGKIEGRREEDQVQALRELLQLAVLRLAEFERLAVRSVGRSERVLRVVGRVVELARIQRPVIPLLKLDRADTGVFGGLEQLLADLDVAAMVVIVCLWIWI